LTQLDSSTAAPSLSEPGVVPRIERNAERHIDSLDGIRGIAILLVVFFHYLPVNPANPFSAIAGLGWTGVDLFFVLSGFLITGILYDTRGSSNFFKVFYARRALRIFPLYFFVVGLVVAVAALLHTAMSWKAIPFYIYGANVMHLFKDGIPDFTPYFNCDHFWSLAVEEQFYSLWPLVVFFVISRRTLMKICAAGIVGALVFRLVLTHFAVPPVILYSELPSRMDSLLAGAMLALALRAPRLSAWLSRRRLYSLIAACCLLLALLLIKAKTLAFYSIAMSSFGYSLIAGVYFGVLALALMPGTVANRVATLSVLRFFGRYSYGLYIWHALLSPIMIRRTPWFTRHIHPLALSQMVYALVMVAFFTAVALASFHLLESPFLKLKSRFRCDYTLRQSAERPRPELQVVV
jgi:peptidoglycan/LPS O-acetylase OafA/YrhL